MSPTTPPEERARRRVLVLYNCDYDAELGGDRSAVRLSALAMGDAVAEYGFSTEVRAIQGLDITEVFEGLRREPPDLVFNLTESLNGDPRSEIIIPALLDMIKLPYTGTGPVGLAFCLHKHRCKQILRAHDLPTPAARLVRSVSEIRDDPGLGYPLFCKLDYEDASVGVEAGNVVHDHAGLLARVGQMIPEFGQPVLIERFIAGREVNASVLGNGDDARVLPLHEIDFSAMPAGRPHIVTYAGKWDESHVDYVGTKPVPLAGADPTLLAAIERTALATYRALGLRDFGRVDLRIDDAGRPWVIDVNPNCDLSRDAGFARAARAAGLDYPVLVGRICELAWRRHADDGALPRAD